MSCGLLLVQLGGWGRRRWGSEGLPFKSGSLIVLIIGGIVKVKSHFLSKAKILSPYPSTVALIPDSKVSEC